MPRRSVLSTSERENLLALPTSDEELIRHYTLTEQDISVIRQRRGRANRLGFAVLLCYLRYPGRLLGPKENPHAPLVEMVAGQLKVPADFWAKYGDRPQTRREHLVELQHIFGFQLLTKQAHKEAVERLAELGLQTEKGIVLATALVEDLRTRKVILPSVATIERTVAEAMTEATRRAHAMLVDPLSVAQRERLDALLLLREGAAFTTLAWIRQPPFRPTSRSMLEHLRRLETLRALKLPEGIERQLHQNRLRRMAREGGQMTPSDLAKLEPQRRYATLVALVVESITTVTDEIIDLNDRIIGKLFNLADRRYRGRFQEVGREMNEKVRLYGSVGQALVDARSSGTDPFEAIEEVLPWAKFEESVAEAKKLAGPADLDPLHEILEGYSTLRRYAAEFLRVLRFKAAPAAAALLDAISLLREMNAKGVHEVPKEAAVGFVRPRWARFVGVRGKIDRRYYEVCALSELRTALRSGDIWVEGSRRFKDFDEYLMPVEHVERLKDAGQLPLAVTPECDIYLYERLSLLKERLAEVDRQAAENGLPDAVITDGGLKITPLDPSVPDDAQRLIDLTSTILPRVRVTELLLEVEAWTNFSRHFTHLKSNDRSKNTTHLLTAILADALNLGLMKMADCSPGATYSKLAWMQAWYIRDETYSLALSEIVNAQFRQPFARYWGEGKTSSSDGQRFKAGGRAESTGHINPKYGTDPGRMFYTHISDQYAPFSAKVINVGVRDSTYVLDGLLYHESELQIEEHYTDTAGFTDHVFALMHLLGFRFAPRIRDLGETRLYIPSKELTYDALAPLVGGTINIEQIRAHWDEILRLATSIKTGVVTASLMLRKLGSYPKRNGLAVALRELGRIERTLFILDWLQNVELRRRVHSGLNKGEARNALARAVFFHRLGEIRDRTFEHQRHRASGLNLVTAAISLWNTVYLGRAVKALRDSGHHIDDSLLPYLSPLGWEHINLTGDYLWRSRATLGPGKFRKLRPVPKP